MTVPSLHERRQMYPAPEQADVGDLRGLITEFVKLHPAAPLLADLGFFFFDFIAKSAVDALIDAFPKITVAERVILARFVLHYAEPDAAQDEARAACEKLIELAMGSMLNLALAECDIMSLPGNPDAIEHMGQSILSGQPPEMGLWLAYAVLTNLLDALGHDHYLVELARRIMAERDPRRDS